MADLRRRYGPNRHCPTGSAVITVAGNLPARWVIHAVGPIWFGGDEGEPALLGSAYRTALRLARVAGARSVTLPAIGTGVYGYPLELAAPIALEAARDHLAGETTLARATFVLYSGDSLAVFEQALAELAVS
jgi:O-acetyl-ADP-ribose deacetylase (regulator of RNase III)